MAQHVGLVQLQSGQLGQQGVSWRRQQEGQGTVSCFELGLLHVDLIETCQDQVLAV